MKPIIALDADGVLLNYHTAYRRAWTRAFGELPALRDANAYWAIDRWEVRRLEGEALASPDISRGTRDDRWGVPSRMAWAAHSQ